MLFVLGLQRFGRVDTVPGSVHVATMFFHVAFVPLIPVQSQLVIQGDAPRRLPSLRWKSVFVAWLRTALVLGTLAGAAGAALFQSGASLVTDLFPRGFDKTTGSAILGGGALLCLSLLIASYKLTRASADVAAELLAAAGR